MVQYDCIFAYALGSRANEIRNFAGIASHWPAEFSTHLYDWGSSVFAVLPSLNTIRVSTVLSHASELDTVMDSLFYRTNRRPRHLTPLKHETVKVNTLTSAKWTEQRLSCSLQFVKCRTADANPCVATSHRRKLMCMCGPEYRVPNLLLSIIDVRQTFVSARKRTTLIILLLLVENRYPKLDKMSKSNERNEMALQQKCA